MKKMLIAAGVCIAVMSVPVYANEDTDIDVTIEAYWMSDSVLRVEEDDWEGGTMISEYGGVSYIASEAGITIAQMLEESGVFSLEAVSESDVFEGWLECELLTVVDEFGFETTEYAIAEDAVLYTQEEFLELEIPDHDVMYVAKWESIPVEEYFQESEEEYMEYASLSIDANGGVLIYEGEEVSESAFGFYTVEAGQTMKEVMEADSGTPLIGVEKEGAEFAGWNVYTCETIEWLEEPAEGEGIVCVPFGEDTYTVLTGSVTVAELVSLEEMGEIVCEDTDHYAVAIWK